MSELAARCGGPVGDCEIANSSFGIEFNFVAYNRELHINHQVIFYRLA